MGNLIGHQINNRVRHSCSGMWKEFKFFIDFDKLKAVYILLQNQLRSFSSEFFSKVRNCCVSEYHIAKLELKHRINQSSTFAQKLHCDFHSYNL